MKKQWQIRDVAHAKVFSFDTWSDMEVWILGDTKEERKLLARRLIDEAKAHEQEEEPAELQTECRHSQTEPGR